jgi:ankyrin repeat protein
MCENGTRVIHFQNALDVNLSPLTVSKYALPDSNKPFTVTLVLNHITSQSDYQIFNAYKMGNVTEVFDLIEAHKGVNAVDEWGHTLLMLATQKGDLQTVALLLNTRMPKVDVNKAKSVCPSLIRLYL